MMGNEKGFTLAESLLGLSVLLISAVFIVPFCMKIIAETSSRWERQEGMRKLYEEAESRLYQPASFSQEVAHPHFTGRIFWEFKNGKEKACLSMDHQTTCVSEQ